MAGNQTLLGSPTVDDLLGPADERFFSSGYRRVRYTFGEVHATVDGAAGLHLGTSATLRYPSDWSRKGGAAAAPPHLSTVDAILIGAQLTELTLTHAFGLDPEQRRRSWLRSMTVQAGTTPDEDLSGLPVRSRLADTVPGPDGVRHSDVVIMVGGMRIRCTAAHPGESPQLLPGRYRDPAAVLGPAERRYFATGFSRGGHRIDGLRTDPETPRATAAVTVTPADGADHGLAGAYQPCLTAVDAFVTTLQLGQVLLYRLDGMTRASSDTLWMRSTTLTAGTPAAAPVPGTPLSVSLHDPRVVELCGHGWRTAEVRGSLGPIRLTCAVAHRLPL